jgi:7-cyano-7-deazaguanine synthase
MEEAQMGGIALLSGGLDSTVAAAHAVKHDGLDLALTVDYGQRSAARELAAAAAIARKLGVAHRSVAAPFVGDCSGEPGGSALLDRGRSIPERKPEELDLPAESQEDARAVWVPNRNGLLINIAACCAESAGFGRIIVGFNAEEAASFPDNSHDFLEAATAALAYSTLNGVVVESPTVGLDKTGVVRLGLEIGAPLELIWSCYREGPAHCWKCPSCLRLKRAFERNGAFDPAQFSGGNET